MSRQSPPPIPPPAKAPPLPCLPLHLPLPLEMSRQPLEMSRQPLEMSRQPLQMSRQPLEVSRQPLEMSRKTLQPKVTYSSQSNMEKNQKIGIFFFIFWFSLRREGTHSEEASKREGSLVCKRDNTIFFIIVIYYQPGLHFKSSKSL